MIEAVKWAMYEMKTLPRSPVHSSCRKVRRWYSVPSKDAPNQVYSLVAASVSCGPMSQERPFPSLWQSLAIGDEILIPLRILKLWPEEKNGDSNQLNTMSGETCLLSFDNLRLGKSGLQNPAESSTLKESVLRSECLSVLFENLMVFSFSITR